jgi:hypothetical protein
MMALWRELLLKIRGATPRERAGLAILGAVAALAAAIMAFDWALTADQIARDAAARHADAAATLAQSGDPAFQENLAVETNKVWRWSIAEASSGVAQSQAITALEGLAMQAGLMNVSVTAEELSSEENYQAVTPLKLTLNADFDWGSFQALLQAMEASDLSLSLEALELAPDESQAAKLTMVVRAPFLREAQQQ